MNAQVPGPTPTSSTSSSSDDDTSSEDDSLTAIGTADVRRGKGGKHGRKGPSGGFGNQPLAPTYERDFTFLVGNKHYRLPSSSAGLGSKLLKQQNLFDEDGRAFIDLSSHSPQEFQYVLEFLSRLDVKGRINWHSLPVLLPWFVELQALPQMNEVDMFLLHNALGGRSDGTARTINLGNLLKVAKIAYTCGLETTKLQVRRFLRHGLLQPRKHTNNISITYDESGSELEDVELDWSLDDLKNLAELMEHHDDCRNYLWEYAVITYLPHDLDISDSLGLVSNSLFPYLLREGMMQMMIVETMESSSYNEISSASFHRKTSKSFSDTTTSSDATIPTAPSSPWRALSQEEMERHLKRTLLHLEKFQIEKELRTSSEDSSTLTDEKKTINNKMGARRKDRTSTNKNNKAGRRQHHYHKTTSGNLSYSRSPETFAC
jgi:hypothetical protein